MMAGAVILLIAMPIHEFSHGLMADRLGDPTPRKHKRLTLNPLRHIDPMGSLMILVFGFGWAKPVLIDAENFRHPRRDMALVAVMGPLSNIAVAFVANIVFVLLRYFDGYIAAMSMSFIFTIIGYIIMFNLWLAVFNLLPIPPLDGSKFFGALLPDQIYFRIMRYERYVGILLLVLIFTGRLLPFLQQGSRMLLAVINFLTMPFDILFYSILRH